MSDKSVLFKGWRLSVLGFLCCVVVAGGIWIWCYSLGTNKPLRSDVNIVIFLIDTLRADRLGVYGYPKPTSPNIDALAAESVVFEQCNSPAPWTLPSVVSILTSKFPCEHGVLVDGQKINPKIEPLAVRLKKVGYTTCSLFVNAYPGPMSGLDRGYDICRHIRTWNADGIRAIDGTTVEQWLENLADGPFYLYIHNVEPHNPHEAPLRLVKLFGEESGKVKQDLRQLFSAYRRLTRVDFMAHRPLGSTDNTAKQQAAMRRLDRIKNHINVLYNAAVRQADEQVGSVIEVLKRRGEWNNTLFILIADHGEEIGEHGGWLHDQSVYEELVHVPLMIHFPDSLYAGDRIKNTVSLVDLMPTILDYLQREELATELSGSSLMPFVHATSRPDEKKFTITAVRMNRKKYYRPYKEMRGDVNIVVRQGRFKGIWNAEIDSIELYDLANDPSEKVNLNMVYVERAEAMRNHAKNWLSIRLKNAIEAMGGRQEVFDKETIENLKSLGYIE